MELADGVASLRVGGRRHRASIHNDKIRIRRPLGRDAAAFEQLALQRCAIGLRRATAKLFDVKRGHRCRSAMGI
jgi:hypothetical protein